MELWLKILTAVFLAFMAFRLWPAASHMLKHGPRGSSADWRGVLLPLLAVIGFVVLLILMVRN